MCTSLLFAAAILMIFGAVGNAFVIVPDLHGDTVAVLDLQACNGKMSRNGTPC